jgi:import inner membrane translocase subunit TIM23
MTNLTGLRPTRLVPDFYGEKIQSVQGYRQWLKDQRAFNKKKSANFV